METSAQNPDVSVIIAVRDGAGTIAATLDSVLRQTMPRWEAIVVDDGSTDATADIVTGYCQRDARVRLARMTQGGVSRARNQGIALARGACITFLDADDWHSPEFLRHMLTALAAHPDAAAAYCGSLRVLPDGSTLTELPGTEMTFTPELERAALPLLAHYCPLAIHAVVVRRAAVVAAGEFDASLTSSEDWDLWMRIARAGGTFVGVPLALAFYRMSGQPSRRDPLQTALDAQRVIARAREGISAALAASLPDKARCDASVTLYFAATQAGAGKDARAVLATLRDWPAFDDDEWLRSAATDIEAGLAVGACCEHGLLAQQWPQFAHRVQDMLAIVGAQRPGVAARLRTLLEEQIFSSAAPAAGLGERAVATSTSAPRVGAAARVPVLMYHSINATGPAALAQWRTHPERFEEQLAYLREQGYCSVLAADIVAMLRHGRELPERCVMLSFDDGFCDFAQHAWPLLSRYGFSAQVFLVTDLVGKVAAWDAHMGPPAPLMDWPEIRRLRDQGIAMGSHLATHRRATDLSREELFDEAARSRSTLERELGTRVTSVAMPFGIYDERLLEVLESTGYECGFTTEDGFVRAGANLMTLPRIEIMGSDDLAAFSTKLAAA
jgi:peptidoglycan/xylan/chitin deacetylase (PgdA/CDA1 family)/GT2 family glycosyltransferase